MKWGFTYSQVTFLSAGISGLETKDAWTSELAKQMHIPAALQRSDSEADDEGDETTPTRGEYFFKCNLYM